MKEIKNKITRYSTAVGALMAVSGAAIASPTPGTIMLNHTPSPLGYDGNAILDHNGDRVYIDMDNNGTPDFYAEMTQSGPMLNARLVAYNSFLNPLVAGESGSTIIKKYVSNEQIGTSFVNPLSSGVISSYSSLGDAQASALAETPTPLGASFVNTGDQGYIGVSLGNPGSAKYGWIQVEIGTNTQTVDFIACALESQANSAILAGSSQPVPVLPIASVAGMGLIGLMAAMKRRKKATV